MDFAKVFEGRDVAEIKGIVDAGKAILKDRKDEIAETAKAEREATKAAADAAGREAVAGLDEGDRIVIVFKGEKVEVEFVKMTEKRFTVEVEGVKRSIMFDKFVEAVEADEVEDETDEDVEDIA